MSGRIDWDGKEFLCTGVSLKIDNEKGIILVDIEGEASTWGPEGIAGEYPAMEPSDDPPAANPPEYWPGWPPGATPDNPDGDPPPWIPSDPGDPPGSLLSDIVAFWKMEEETDHARWDSVNGWHTGGNQDANQVEGHIGYAAEFLQADSDYLRVGTADGFEDDFAIKDRGSGFTVAFWAQHYLTPAADFWCWVSKAIEDAAPWADNVDYAVELRPTLEWVFIISTTDAGGSQQRWIRATTYGVVPINTWVFVVAWYDGDAHQLAISINNGTPDTYNIPDDEEMANYGGDFFIGRDGGAFGDYADGRIDALGVWQRMLTSEERTYLWRDGIGRQYPFF